MQVSCNGWAEMPWRVLGLAGAERSELTAARRWAEAELAALGEPTRVDVLIVVGELLENAFVHAGQPLDLRIHHVPDPCEVTVAVTDAGTGEPRLRVPGREGGRGLLLVDRICAAWGVGYHDEGKTVWARIECEDDAEPG